MEGRAPWPKVAFTDSFLVEEKKNKFGDFIRIVRHNVIKSCSTLPGIVQPVLPREKVAPALPDSLFHVVLRTKTSSVTLAIRIDNLYLVGFRTQAGVWWELGKEGDTRLIEAESKWLGFGGRYQDLIGQKALDTVTLGRDQMARSVNSLARHGTGKMSEEEELHGAPVAVGMSEEPFGGPPDPYALPKSMLAPLVIMICEGLRFLTVAGTVDGNFDVTKPVPTITHVEKEQVNEWGKISVKVFEWAKNPNANFPELEVLGIKNKTDAERVVALVKYPTK